MDIYFLDHEPTDEAYFEAQFPQYQLHFLNSLDAVPAAARVISIFISSKITADFLASHPALRFVATRSTTFDHIDLEACRRAGVTVSYVPSYGKYTVAEHTFALILALARRLREAIGAHRSPAFSYESLRGMRLRSKTIGVIGAGRIGLRVLHLARGFGMKRLAYDIQHRPELAARLGFEYVELPELLERSDIISLHVPLTPASYHMLNRETLTRCRPGALIINTARGALIDSEALLEALDAGIVGGAGLDVLEDERVFHDDLTKIVSKQILHRLHEPFPEREARVQEPGRINEITKLIHNERLLARADVVFTPHIAFNSVEAVECINRTTVGNIEAFLGGRPLNVLVTNPRSADHPHSMESSAVGGGGTPSYYDNLS